MGIRSETIYRGVYKVDSYCTCFDGNRFYNYGHSNGHSFQMNYRETTEIFSHIKRIYESNV